MGRRIVSCGGGVDGACAAAAASPTGCEHRCLCPWPLLLPFCYRNIYGQEVPSQVRAGGGAAQALGTYCIWIQET